MRNLIDRNALYEKLENAKWESDFVNGHSPWNLGARVQTIANMPTIDAVPVVRCKDCKFRWNFGCPMYHEDIIDIDDGDGYHDSDLIIHDYSEDNGFCNQGQRRE